MAALAIPLLEGAGEAIAAAWSAFVSSGVATATAGGAATAAILALPGDTAQENDKAKAEAQANTRTRQPRCKCPPEKSGEKVRRKRNMNPEPRRYQARITGYEYGITTDGKGRETKDGWNMEFCWLGTDFDGFMKEQCLLQEAKGNYDQLLDKFFDENGDARYNFDGFTATKAQIFKQGTLVKQNPPTKLMWYFQTPEARAYLMDTLVRASVPSLYQP
ncbi:hypothetical protein EN871_21780 [bacterium M00.F.Ca.ET.228.01.1.1]|uniref:Tox-REase-5 domain-containing protein n=1 Tax=Paraburkholderia phenoliruptrix TaxID=252970 RepID=UPI001091A7AF|nr:Tox-REase-5 domain-containing protein [Paraburkholderia phenoliruptrix]TGP41624.1 hypothetical protein EN871_21780 [bacterium M00.F.Ca.ET.228.01.1.1]TGR98415.1 hypothetical protein EN834_21395 [bacterium M00.F.Ca.ET.191.01.1.1]TGU02749.1 hypothetical protein EN798_22215 [bacterium M00.F.Ca.ET.155.01.1.1]MBW0447581.1 hypothetical protein [Paraburkholderia phenoliruptrix]MBW9098216.1 hypothetical protein [Paraburkholderia phenoliruptrix]